MNLNLELFSQGCAFKNELPRTANSINLNMPYSEQLWMLQVLVFVQCEQETFTLINREVLKSVNAPFAFSCLAQPEFSGFLLLQFPNA